MSEEQRSAGGQGPPRRPPGDGPPAGGGRPPEGGSGGRAEAPTEPLGPRRLTRSRENRLIGGVAGGLARYFGVDPIIARIAFAALAVFGGIGVFVYLAALLFVPSEGADGAPAGPPVAGQGRLAAAAGTAVLAIAALAILSGGLFFPGPIGVLAVAAIAGYAMLRRHEGDRPSAGRVAARVGIGVGVLALSVAGFLLSGWASATGYGAVVAVLVVLLGVALVAGAVARRREARWLVLPAAVLAVPLAIVSAADLDLRGGFGERTFRPASVAQVPPGYRLGAGRMEIDLRGAGLGPGERRLGVSLGAGEAVVVVPRDVCVQTDARVGAGMVRAFDRSDGGTDVRVREQAAPGAAPKRLVLSADVGMGALHVVNDPSAAGHGRGGPRGDHGRGGPGFGGPGFGGDERSRGPGFEDRDEGGEDGGDNPEMDEDDDDDRAGAPPQAACGPTVARAGSPGGLR